MTAFNGNGHGWFWTNDVGWRPAQRATMVSRGGEATEAELDALRTGLIVIEGDTGAFVYPPRALPTPGLRPAQEEDW